MIALVLSCVPGLHIYSVLAVVVAVVGGTGDTMLVSRELMIPFVVSMTTGYSIVSSIPAIVVAAPDESAALAVRPGQKLLMSGRGYEAVMLVTLGGVIGLGVLLILGAPMLPIIAPIARAVFRGHSHWIVWCVICFMLMSEWPMSGTVASSGWAALFNAWTPLAAGILTFVLSGALGFVLFFRSPVSTGMAFQSLMPAFVGLFTMPTLVLNILNPVRLPRQAITFGGRRSAKDEVSSVLRGAAAGVLGGSFAAFFPAVTGGVGGLLAGHATSLRDSRAFLVSQGASRMVYYVGAVLLLLTPGCAITRGGGAWMLRSLFDPGGYPDYYMALASAAICGAVIVPLMPSVTVIMLRLVSTFGQRSASALSLLAALFLVLGLTGVIGLGIAFVSLCIGLIPVMYGSRRINCLGVVLLPVACNMSGSGVHIARMMGLVS